MLQYLMTYLNAFLRDEEGQDLTEYALVLVLIVIVAIGAMALIGPIVEGYWDAILAALP